MVKTKIATITQKNNGREKHDVHSLASNENQTSFSADLIDTAVINAGGFGTRLKEITRHTPKPMILVGGRPMLSYTLEFLRIFGITNIYITVHHLSEKITSYYGDGSRFGLKIHYLYEEEPLGTSGALRFYRHHFFKPFILCNSDELKIFNIAAMIQQHVTTGADATIALTSVEDPSSYGVVDVRGRKIRRFVEKPDPDEAPSNLINAGFYILNPSVIDILPEGFSMVEKDLFPPLASLGSLYGFSFEGPWFDTGTPERLARARNNWRHFERSLELIPLAYSLPDFRFHTPLQKIHSGKDHFRLHSFQDSFSDHNEESSESLERLERNFISKSFDSSHFVP